MQHTASYSFFFSFVQPRLFFEAFFESKLCIFSRRHSVARERHKVYGTLRLTKKDGVLNFAKRIKVKQNETNVQLRKIKVNFMEQVQTRIENAKLKTL